MSEIKEIVSIPLIQVDDEVREMTTEEHAVYLEQIKEMGQK
jgi:hypothetical protein